MAKLFILDDGEDLAHIGMLVRAVIESGGENGQFERIERIRVHAAPDMPLEAYAPVVAQAVADGRLDLAGSVLIAPNRPAGRSLAASAAFAAQSAMVSGVRSLSPRSVEYVRYGGLLLQTVALNAQHGLVGIVDDSAVPDDGAGDVLADVPILTLEDLDQAVQYQSVRVVQEVPDAATDHSLAQARRVVVAGLGFEAEEDLDLARELADVLGAECAGTMPLAIPNGWIGKDEFVGVSGAVIAPEIYVGVGVSGAIQHTAGITGASTIIAINDDEEAPLFKEADYGIVGDLYEVLPQLSDALRAKKNRG
ncbi:MAG: electron transfer flavoprotein subunit alpha/FixB family protein [Actinomycetaceae bacterium]|nr:electron transfer flavoprotein subunit alpha/FixB family protein [Actinomycetaceae bacterium]MDY6082887.1 electron transfer flavoprotein subunit alpha/FixB family protein [Actinomycetaceae bacterium]